MGYGQYGGGGSVHWKVKHSGKTKSDVDPVSTVGEYFTVIINGVVQHVPIDNNNPRQIMVIWPPDNLASATEDSLKEQAMNEAGSVNQSGPATSV